MRRSIVAWALALVLTFPSHGDDGLNIRCPYWFYKVGVLLSMGALVGGALTGAVIEYKHLCPERAAEWNAALLGTSRQSKIARMERHYVEKYGLKFFRSTRPDEIIPEETYFYMLKDMDEHLSLFEQVREVRLRELHRGVVVPIRLAKSHRWVEQTEILQRESRRFVLVKVGHAPDEMIGLSPLDFTRSLVHHICTLCPAVVICVSLRPNAKPPKAQNRHPQERCRLIGTMDAVSLVRSKTIRSSPRSS